MAITNYIKQKAPSYTDVGFMKVIDNGDGTVTIAENQTFCIQDVVINTSDFSLAERTFAIPLGFGGQIRFSLNGTPCIGVSPNKRSFYLYTDSLRQYPGLVGTDDLGICNVSRDATTGVISFPQSIFEFYSYHQQYLSYTDRIFIVDAVNGNDNNPGTLEEPLQTIDALGDVCASYKSISVLLQPGTYTPTKQLPSNYSWRFATYDITNPATINYGLNPFIGISEFQNILFNHLNINITSGYVLRSYQCKSTSSVYVENCTITLTGGIFGSTGNGCWPVVVVDNCTIIKPSTYVFWQSNALSLDYYNCTIQDGAGNALTTDDISVIIRDTNGSIRNFLTFHNPIN